MRPRQTALQGMATVPPLSPASKKRTHVEHFFQARRTAKQIFPAKKIREAETSRTFANFYAPLGEAPDGPPGGHFRTEEASPEIFVLHNFEHKTRQPPQWHAFFARGLVGLRTNKGRNFQIILIVHKVFMAGFVRVAALMPQGFTLQLKRKPVAVFIIPALNLGAA